MNLELIYLAPLWTHVQAFWAKSGSLTLNNSLDIWLVVRLIFSSGPSLVAGRPRLGTRGHGNIQCEILKYQENARVYKHLKHSGLSFRDPESGNIQETPSFISISLISRGHSKTQNPRMSRKHMDLQASERFRVAIQGPRSNFRVLAGTRPHLRNN